MQTIFPRPGGGTIAAGNRDSPPGRLAAHRRGVLGFGHSLRVSFPHAPFPFQQVSFLQVSFPAGRFLQYAVFFLGGFHPGSPLSPLVGRILVTLGPPLDEMWRFIFRCVFLECFFYVLFVRFWIEFRIIRVCFSHTCSSCVCSYLLLGCCSNVCAHYNLFWRNRLCGRNARKWITGDGFVPCCLANVRYC